MDCCRKCAWLLHTVQSGQILHTSVIPLYDGDIDGPGPKSFIATAFAEHICIGPPNCVFLAAAALVVVAAAAFVVVNKTTFDSDVSDIVVVDFVMGKCDNIGLYSVMLQTLTTPPMCPGLCLLFPWDADGDDDDDDDADDENDDNDDDDNSGCCSRCGGGCCGCGGDGIGAPNPQM